MIRRVSEPEVNGAHGAKANFTAPLGFDDITLI